MSHFCCPVQLTGVKDVLNATSGVTVLAPSEDAFKQFFDALVQRGWNTTCCGGSVEELPVDVLTMVCWCSLHALPLQACGAALCICGGAMHMCTLCVVHQRCSFGALISLAAMVAFIKPSSAQLC